MHLLKVAIKSEKKPHSMFSGRLVGFKNNKNYSMVCRKGGRGRLRQVAVY